MSILILPDDGPQRLIYFDTEMNVTPEESNEVTRHPVEDGSKISDYVITNPASLTFDGFVTETPMDRDGLRARGATMPLFFTVQPPPRLGLFGALIDLASPPVPTQQIAMVLQFQPFQRIQEMYDDLSALRDEKVTCTVDTDLRTFEGMVLESFTPMQEGQDACTFKCKFSQIRTVELRTVNAPKPKEPRAIPSAAKGSQAVQETLARAQANAEQAKLLAGSGDKGSILAKLLGL